MLRAKPIPRALLTHSIEYSEKLPAGRYGGEGFADPIIINNVRVVFSSKIVKNGDNLDEIATANIYLDARHTKPFIELQKESKIMYAGKSYTVDVVSPAVDIQLHHYKVGIV